MESISLPVQLNDSYEGLAETTGLLKVKGDALFLQFQTKDAILGMLKSDLTEVEIGFQFVDEISYKKSILGNKLIIVVNDLRAIEKLPGNENNKVSLSVSRADFDDAVDLVRAIRLDMSEREYQQAMNDS